MKLEIKTAKSTQSAVPELKREEKTLYFLIIGNEDAIVTLNVGEKTYNSITKLIENESNTEIEPPPQIDMEDVNKKRRH